MLPAGITIEKDKSIAKLDNEVFSRMLKLGTPVGVKPNSPTGVQPVSIEAALKELLELQKKSTS